MEQTEKDLNALRFKSHSARFSFRNALARFTLYLYDVLRYKYASIWQVNTSYIAYWEGEHIELSNT